MGSKLGSETAPWAVLGHRKTPLENIKSRCLVLRFGFNCVGAGEASPDAEVGKELSISILLAQLLKQAIEIASLDI